MPIHRQGDYLIWPDSGSDAPMLGLESDRIDDCIDEVRRGGYVGVFASPAFGYKSFDLEALRRLPPLRHIWLWDMDLKSVDGLYAHPDLQFFGLHGKRPAVDFGQFTGLRTVSTDWKGRDFGLAQQSLQDFRLWHHKPRSKSFSTLETPAYCNRVVLNWTNARSLEGLSGLVGTESLALSRSRNMESLSGIEIFRDSLKKVIVTACGKLRDLSALDALPRLGLAIVDGTRHRG